MTSLSALLEKMTVYINLRWLNLSICLTDCQSKEIRHSNREAYLGFHWIIVPEEHHATWLGEVGDGDLKELLKPFPADQMKMWRSVQG
jgi:hypothetical protein